MSNNLNEFLAEKRQAIEQKRIQAEITPPTGPNTLRASTHAEGRTSIRRIRIRDFQILSDSGPDFAGYDLVLRSSLALTFLLAKPMGRACLLWL